MSGLNSSLNIGLSGLQATQSALNVVGHNITNINTPNYSRQVVNLSSAGAVYQNGQMYGQGVNLTSISGIRNRLLDLQISQTLSRQMGAQTRDNSIESVSTAFEDDGTSGLSTIVGNFFKGFQDLASNPENTALRTNLVGQAQTLVDGLKSRYQMLTQVRDSANSAISDQVSEVNTLTAQIADLNKAIASEAATGANSDARDQRSALVDKLSKLVGIQAFEDDDGRLQIMLESGAGILVAGDKASTLTATADPALGNYYRVDLTSGSAAPTDVTGGILEGSLGANLDLRDNIIPGYQSQLDQLAAGIASGVNQLHYNGYAKDGVQTNNYFFTGTVANNGLPTGITSANNYLGMVNSLSVNAAIKSDSSLIAAAGASGESGNNANAKAIFNLSSSGQFTTQVSSLINGIGTDAQRFATGATNYENLSTALQNQRESVSGVDLDEEATNLMAYQRGYQACARFINVIDQLTNQLINNFGQ
ncbi:MAG: flagellar hook-associated protein FlgK [Holophagaceae bacterium]|nr:flagellar hook-associated protein FlgK [Holophagaceae bacterium]